MMMHSGGTKKVCTFVVHLRTQIEGSSVEWGVRSYTLQTHTAVSTSTLGREGSAHRRSTGKGMHLSNRGELGQHPDSTV